MIPSDRVKQQQSNRWRGKETRQNICSAPPPQTAPQRSDSLPKRELQRTKIKFLLCCLLPNLPGSTSRAAA